MSLTMEDDEIEETAASMMAGFAKQRALIAEHKSGQISSDSKEGYVALSEGVLAMTDLQILMRWGQELANEWNIQTTDEANQGLHRRCGSCSDETCRGDVACWSAADSEMASSWESVFDEWGGGAWNRKAKTAVERYMIRQAGVGALPSIPANLLSDSLAARAAQSSTSDPLCTVWDVFMRRLTDVWTSMNEPKEFDRRLWLARFHRQSMSAKWSPSKLVDLQTAWSGFTLAPAQVNMNVNSLHFGCRTQSLHLQSSTDHSS
jgi:hypothetical protein